MDSFAFGEVQIASNCKQVRKPRHNSRTKLRIQISHIHKRDNIVFYLHCKFQSSPFSVRRKNSVTDRLKNSTSGCRCLGEMALYPQTQLSTNTATADACIQDFCTAITMQCSHNVGARDRKLFPLAILY